MDVFPYTCFFQEDTHEGLMDEVGGGNRSGEEEKNDSHVDSRRKKAPGYKVVNAVSKKKQQSHQDNIEDGRDEYENSTIVQRVAFTFFNLHSKLH